MSASTGPFQCVVPGCNKKFARKEHMVRHERTHTGNVFQCSECTRHFNRSDSLLRHMTIHKDWSSKSSGRSKRACVACHSGKVKCDGRQGCSRCIKRGIECIYLPLDGMDPDDALLAEPSALDIPQVTPAPPVQTEAGTSALQSPLPKDPPDLNLLRPETSVQLAQRVPDGIIDVMQMQIRVETSVGKSIQDIQDDNQDNESFDPNRYLDLYYQHFDHRWPIIHRFSADDSTIGEESELMVSAMKMIGAWIEGSDNAKSVSKRMHHEMVDNLMSRLSRVTASDCFQQSISAALCQAALLNIVLGLYIGDDRMLSRVIVLRNILVAALRDMEFFKIETAWAQDRPGYFLPMRTVKDEVRKRLALYLFKIDNYISLTRNQSTLILQEELHMDVPSTYSMFSGNGLHIWEERHNIEPEIRCTQSAFRLLNDVVSSHKPEIPILIEDLHLAFCSLQANVFKLSYQFLQSSVTTALQTECLRRQLQTLKERLGKFPLYSATFEEFEQSPHIDLRQYHGWEDSSHPNRQEIILARPRDLLFDITALYHLLSLQVDANINMLANLAKDRNLTHIQQLSERHGVMRNQREEAVKSWVASSSARGAVCHAVDVLCLIQATSTVSRLAPNHRDPISHVAICLGALVIWAYCAFTPECQCSNPNGTMPPIELTQWSAGVRTVEQENEKRTWINLGEFYPVRINGIPVCKHSVHILIEMFRICLPPDWELRDRLAPGIFTLP